MKVFDRLYQSLTLRHILLLALILRLIAAFFSRGFLFLDDHFEVVEVAQKWRLGIPFNTIGEDKFVFSQLYPGLHYLIIEVCTRLGLTDPQDMMLITRLLHGLLSLLAVYYAYLLTIRLTGNGDTAKKAALLMAAFWIFPVTAVHSLRESFCVPFLMIGCYHLAGARLNNRSVILAALFFIIAFCIRIQCLIFPAAAGLFLLFKKRMLKLGLLFGLACIVFYFLTQGLFDWVYFGNPFDSVITYFEYNANPANIAKYPQGPWYQYIGTVAGMLFGFSFFPLAFGYIKSPRASFGAAMIFAGSLLFFLVHSYYSNKQERFMLPFIPFFLILGITGLQYYREKQQPSRLYQKTALPLRNWFVILNGLGLLVVTGMYSKRSRVESMTYLHGKGDVTNIIMEHQVDPPMAPLFYLDRYFSYFVLTSGKSPEELTKEINASSAPKPNYLIMTGNKDFEARLSRIRSIYPNIRHEADIKPGFIDNITFQLNPKHNPNETWRIYRLE